MKSSIFTATLFVSLAIWSTLSAQSMTAGKSARGDWATIRARISEWGDVHLFSDTTEALKGSNLVFNWDSDSDLLTSFNAWLREKGLTCIAYNEETWIVVAYADAERSLEAWKRRNKLLEAISAQPSDQVSATVIGAIQSGEAAKGQLTLTGIVRDEETGETIIGATIIPQQGGDPTVSDVDGTFTLQLPVGENRLTVQSIGMEEKEIPIVMAGEGELDVFLHRASLQLEEVVVSEKAADQNLRSLTMGIEQLNMKEIAKLPAFLGEFDVIKSLISLPGVSTAGEGVGGINVRGGNIDQNLIIQDDIIYFNPSHALGFFSLFHPDLVDDVKLFKGNIPAKYGGRLSSVLSTGMRTGSKEEWTIKAGLGIMSSKLALEGPLVNNKTSIILGGRISYINWILGLVNLPDVQDSRVSFSDFQGKLDHRLNNKSSIGLEGYQGSDYLRFANEARFNYGTRSLAAYYNTLIGNRANLNTKLIYGNYYSDLGDLKILNPSVFKTGIEYVKGRSELVFQKNQRATWVGGIEATRYQVNPGILGPDNDESAVVKEETPREQGIEGALYLETEQRFSDLFSFSAGLRFSGFILQGPKRVRNYAGPDQLYDEATDTTSYAKGATVASYFGLEPRVSMNYRMNETSSLKLGATRTYQYLSLISNTVAATPVDFWKLADSYLKPQRADGISLGYYRNFKNNEWETSAEVYYKVLQNVPEYRDFPDLLGNEFLETELVPAEGQNYGLELSIKKNLGLLTGRLSYTYSRAIRRVNTGIPELDVNRGGWYPSYFDKPHDITTLLNFNIMQRLSLNVSFTYSSGRPITAPTGKYTDWHVVSVPIYSDRNQYRIPDYYRMDVSANLFPGYRKDRRLKSSWSLSVYNLLGRKNAYSIYFRQKPFQSLSTYRLAVLGSIFPSITYNLEW
ncbi:MAG: TonB-dependent receptor [Saprospiraceae bacterium]